LFPDRVLGGLKIQRRVKNSISPFFAQRSFKSKPSMFVQQPKQGSNIVAVISQITPTQDQIRGLALKMHSKKGAGFLSPAPEGHSYVAPEGPYIESIFLDKIQNKEKKK